jgi:hypothetical protein
MRHGAQLADGRTTLCRPARAQRPKDLHLLSSHERRSFASRWTTNLFERFTPDRHRVPLARFSLPSSL